MAIKKNAKIKKTVKAGGSAKPAKAKAIAKRTFQHNRTSTSRTVRPVNNAKGSNGK